MAEVVIVADEDAAGALVADAIVSLIRSKPDAVLGLATGSTPLASYRALAARIADEAIDVRGVRGFALDEYVGLPAGHPESYRAVITREVVEPLGLTPELVRVPNGDPATIEHAGGDYEAAITRGRRGRPADPRHRSHRATSASTSPARRWPRSRA